MAKQYIKTFMATDFKVFDAWSKVGFLTKDHIKDCGVADRRLNNYQRQGLVEKVQYRNPHNKQLEYCYKLTSAGKDFYTLRHEQEHHYYQAQSPQHDLAMADKYFSLSDHERSTWRTETEVRNEFKQHIESLRDQGNFERAKQLEDMYAAKQISVVDAVYETEQGVQVAYEVVTNSYGHQELQAKQEFVEVMKLKYEPQRI